MLRLCANLSLLFTEQPLQARFAAAKKAGFDAVEVQFPYELEIDTIQRELVEHDLKLVLINVPAGDLMQGGNGLACVPGMEQEFRHAVIKAVEYADALNVSCVNVLAGKQPSNTRLLDCLKTLASNLNYAASAFNSIGVTTTFEAINTHDMPHFLIHNVAQMQEMIEAVNHPTLKMQFDIYHMARMGENIAVALAENIEHIGHIQFADVPGRHEPGTGDLHFKTLFGLINALPFHGWCGAEYHPRVDTKSSLEWLDQV